MDEVAYVGLVAVIAEIHWRLNNCTIHDYWTHLSHPLAAFVVSYFLCILVAALDLKNTEIFQHEKVRQLLSLLHSLDGITALIMGLAMYYESLGILYISLIMSTKVFLLTFITRMVTGKSSLTRIDAIMQTTRAYLHHVGSFMFLHDKNVILLTTLWRSLSMTGHALIAFKKKTHVHDGLRGATYEFYVTIVAYIRQIILCLILLLCLLLPTVRRGFAVSAAGHISYMVVRFGPIFHLGSTFIPELHRKEWLQLSSTTKLSHLLRWKYPWLCIELGLLTCSIVYFIYLRLYSYGIIDGQCNVS